MKYLFFTLIYFLFASSVSAQLVSISSGVTVDLDDCYFITSNIGFVVGGQGVVLKTTDGGVNWQEKSVSTLPFLQRPWLHSIVFTDANTGYAIGGGCFKTIDGGETWTELPTGWTTTALFSVCFTDFNTGYIAGGNGNILKTTNGGANWTLQQGGSGIELHGVSFTDSNNGWAVGYCQILHTNNGGTTWTIQDQSPVNYYNCNAIDQNTCYVSGTGGTILKTTDGGVTWNTQLTGTLSDITALFLFDANNGYAVGGQGTILHTIDGGLTWTAQQSGLPTGILFSVYFPATDVGYIAGGSGLFLKTTNGGYTGLYDSFSVNSYMQIWPNPAQETFTINLPFAGDKTVLLMTDLSGRTVHYEPICKTTSTINCSHLNDGLYVIKTINDGKTTGCGKLIIQGNK